MDQTYTISRLCDDYVVLITHDGAHVAANCGNVDTTSSSLNTGNTNSSSTGANQLRGPEPPDICCESTVLVLYTNKAKNVSDPESMASVLIENLNQALKNSDVCHRVALVGIEQISWTESIGDHRGDIEDIQLDSQAQLLRNQYSADIVMVLIGHDYQIGFGRIYGISSADNGYTITSIVSPPGRNIFTHEWSHELGADHHDVQSGFARGYIFSNGRTIMVNGTVDNELHFSNPDIDFNGSATGVIDQRDNARQMDNTGCTISQYRSNNSTCEDFVVFIDGPLVIEAGTTYSWCAIPPECGSEPTYSWEYSYDGFFWQNGGFANCMTLTTGTQNVHVRLTVICNNGCSSTGHFFSLNSDGILGEDCLENALVKQGKRRIHSSTSLVYPNPATNTLNIQWDIKESENQVFDITIHNAFGQSFLVGSFEKSQLLNWSYDVSNFQNGNYYITLVSKNEYAIAKVLVRH